ncbi:MAG: hypothetical protein ACREKF_07940, partial [Candidatus Methylomirabilales bacterium]
MRTLQATVVSLILFATAAEVAALNLKVREVRRSRDAGVVSLMYEVENASVHAVRLERAELQMTDPLGRRLDILPLLIPIHPLERGEATFLRARVLETRLQEAALLTLRVYPLPPFPYPVTEVRVPPVETRFDGPAARRGLSPAARPEGPGLLRPGPWHLRLAGSVLAPTRDAVLLLYALTGPGVAAETPAILEVRYSSGGALLEARSLPVPRGRDGEAYLEILLPLTVARLVDGIEARLFAAARGGVAVHPVTVEGHRQAGAGTQAGTGSPVPPPDDPRRILDPTQAGGDRP